MRGEAMLRACQDGVCMGCSHLVYPLSHHCMLVRNLATQVPWVTRCCCWERCVETLLARM